MDAPNSHRTRLERLAATLPPFPNAGEEVDVGARAALGWLASEALICEPHPRIEAVPGFCPNCGAPHQSTKTPYCGACCKDQAGLVRQVRAGLIEGSIEVEDRQIAFGEKLWRVIGGGYPRRRTLLPTRGWERVLEREGRRCQQCGAPATTIDHAGTG
jgi:hypothetical protein